MAKNTKTRVSNTKTLTGKPLSGCNGAAKQLSGGVVFTPEDCGVRVFGLSGLIDIPPYLLSIWNIPISGCTEGFSHYTTFSSQA